MEEWGYTEGTCKEHCGMVRRCWCTMFGFRGGTRKTRLNPNVTYVKTKAYQALSRMEDASRIFYQKRCSFDSSLLNSSICQVLETGLSWCATS